ncbi:MAG: hypothetical protein SFV15_22470 [Polyangiaceae bacterium]|nr:hypothetical protein [Polyangiaceae bacterium]
MIRSIYAAMNIPADILISEQQPEPRMSAQQRHGISKNLGPSVVRAAQKGAAPEERLPIRSHASR